MYASTCGRMKSSTCGVPLPLEMYAHAQPAALCLLEHVDRPLAGDQRLVVARDDARRAVLDREIDELPSASSSLRRRDGVGVAEHLARHPVLAVAAVEIAAEHAEGQRVGAGQDVEERLLLDRVAREAPT